MGLESRSTDWAARGLPSDRVRVYAGGDVMKLWNADFCLVTAQFQFCVAFRRITTSISLSTAKANC
jgi:hypothetical protein